MKKITVMALLLAGLTFSMFSPLTVRADETTTTTEATTTTSNPATAGCLDEVKKCQTQCEQAMSYCKEQGGKHKEAQHMKIMQDCISTCKMSRDLIGRGSGLTAKACEMCAEACKRCAESCGSFEDATMKTCADECRKCADTCSKISG